MPLKYFMNGSTVSHLKHFTSSSVYNMPLFWKVKHHKIANKYASRCNLWWTGLHDSHNTSQKYVILYLLNVHLYICILSCNIFWQAPIVVCIFINEAFCDLCTRLGNDWSNWSPCQLLSAFTFMNWNAVHCIKREPRMV